jgi:hypothetical protein
MNGFFLTTFVSVVRLFFAPPMRVVTHFERLELLADQNRDSSLPLRMTSCPAIILNAVKDLETK